MLDGLREKAALYAQSRVAEYRVVDLDSECILVHRASTAGGWSSVTRVGRGGALAAGAFPEIAVAVEQLLG